MFNTDNPAAMLVPMLVVVALSFFAFLRLGAARSAAMKGGVSVEYYRAHIGSGEPESVVVTARHYNNMFELPVLFHAACITAFALAHVSVWSLALAWGYVAGRLIQSAVHLTYNNPMHRGTGFVIGVLCLLGLWINLALVIFARL